MMYRTVSMRAQTPKLSYVEEAKRILVPWPEVEALLGRPYAWKVEDDDAVLAALQRSNAPTWVPFANQLYDEAGFVFEKPRGF